MLDSAVQAAALQMTRRVLERLGINMLTSPGFVLHEKQRDTDFSAMVALDDAGQDEIALIREIIIHRISCSFNELVRRAGRTSPA